MYHDVNKDAGKRAWAQRVLLGWRALLSRPLGPWAVPHVQASCYHHSEAILAFHLEPAYRVHCRCSWLTRAGCRLENSIPFLRAYMRLGHPPTISRDSPPCLSSARTMCQRARSNRRHSSTTSPRPRAGRAVACSQTMWTLGATRHGHCPRPRKLAVLRW